MKKTLVSITLIVYLAFSCGVVINYHYCMGHLDSVKLFAKKSNECGTCGMHLGSRKCCGDESFVVRLHDNHQISQAGDFVEPSELVAIAPSEFLIASFFNVSVLRHFDNHSPPLLSAQEIYLQNRVFRI